MNDSARTVSYHNMSHKGRTDLIIGGSEAKYHQESAGDVQKMLLLKILTKINPKQISGPNN